MSNIEPQADSSSDSGVFDVLQEAAAFPAIAETMLVDKYFTDRAEVSSRVFRIYRQLPLHYHRDSDEYLYIISGGGTFHLDGTEHRARPGLFLTFRRGVVHGFPSIDQDRPLVVLALDVPRRRPDDIVFVDPSAGDARTFMARNADQ